MVQSVSSNTPNAPVGDLPVQAGNGNNDYMSVDTPAVNAISVFDDQLGGMRVRQSGLETDQQNSQEIKNYNVQIAQSALSAANRARENAQEQETIISGTTSQIGQIGNGLSYLRGIIGNYSEGSDTYQAIIRSIDLLEKKREGLLEKLQTAYNALLGAKEEEAVKLREAQDAARRAVENGERVEVLGVEIQNIETRIQELEEEIKKLKSFLGNPIAIPNSGDSTDGDNEIPPDISSPPLDIGNPTNDPAISSLEGRANESYENAKLFRSMYETFQDNPTLAKIFASEVADAIQSAQSYSAQAQSMADIISSNSTNVTSTGSGPNRNVDAGRITRNEPRTLAYGEISNNETNPISPISPDITAWKESLGGNELRIV